MSKRARFVIGDIVNYHARIDGPVTSTAHTIKALDKLPSGHDVAWISGKAGCVAIEALSLAALDDKDTIACSRCGLVMKTWPKVPVSVAPLRRGKWISAAMRPWTGQVAAAKFEELRSAVERRGDQAVDEAATAGYAAGLAANADRIAQLEAEYHIEQRQHLEASNAFGEQRERAGHAEVELRRLRDGNSVTDVEINALANEAMLSIETDDAEDYASARAAIEIVIGKAIAKLTAELSEARKRVARGARIAEKARQAGDVLLSVADRMEAVERERDAAQAELAEARKQQKQWQDHAAELIRDELTTRAQRDEARRERDAAQARADKAEADALAANADAMEMHRALSWSCTCENARTCRRCRAMDGHAGRALAARVTLLEAMLIAGRELRDHEATACVVDPACGNCAACRFNAALAALDDKGKENE